MPHDHRCIHPGADFWTQQLAGTHALVDAPVLLFGSSCHAYSGWHVQSINIGGCFNISFEGTHLLVNNHPNAPHFVGVDLSGTHFTDQCVAVCGARETCVCSDSRMAWCVGVCARALPCVRAELCWTSPPSAPSSRKLAWDIQRCRVLRCRKVPVPDHRLMFVAT